MCSGSGNAAPAAAVAVRTVAGAAMAVTSAVGCIPSRESDILKVRLDLESYKRK